MRSDTSKAIVPISFIKDANAKLIERLYLIKIRAEQDSIAHLNKLYINEQGIIIKDFQGRVVDLINDNNKLNSTIVKQRNTNRTLLGISGASVLGLIITLLIK